MKSCMWPDSRVSQLSGINQYHPDALLLTAKVRDFCDQLSAAELKFVSNSVDSRRREYSTGRWIAHQGLTRLGFPNVDILPGNHRQPVWPQGIVGSISHTQDHAIVALARSRNYRSIGIDMEAKFRVESALAEKILTERERSAHSGVDPTLVFSAKEALHKLVFPIKGHYLEFTDVEIEFDHTASTFYPHFLSGVGNIIESSDISGSYCSYSSHWITCISLRSNRMPRAT